MFADKIKANLKINSAPSRLRLFLVEEEYDVFAEFQRQIKKPTKFFDGKRVVCSLQKKAGKREPND